jgi:hypothetical protein
MCAGSIFGTLLWVLIEFIAPPEQRVSTIQQSPLIDTVGAVLNLPARFGGAGFAVILSLLVPNSGYLRRGAGVLVSAAFLGLTVLLINYHRLPVHQLSIHSHVRFGNTSDGLPTALLIGGAIGLVYVIVPYWNRGVLQFNRAMAGRFPGSHGVPLLVLTVRRNGVDVFVVVTVFLALLLAASFTRVPGWIVGTCLAIIAVMGLVIASVERWHD